MLDKNVMHPLMRKKILWKSTNDALIPLSSIVEGQSLKIRINDFPEKDLYTLLVNDKPVTDFNEWPSLWVNPHPPTARLQKKDSFFSSQAPTAPRAQQLIDEFVKLNGNDSKNAVKSLMATIAVKYPDELAEYVKDTLGTHKSNPKAKL